MVRPASRLGRGTIKEQREAADDEAGQLARRRRPMARTRRAMALISRLPHTGAKIGSCRVSLMRRATSATDFPKHIAVPAAAQRAHGTYETPHMSGPRHERRHIWQRKQTAMEADGYAAACVRGTGRAIRTRPSEGADTDNV